MAHEHGYTDEDVTRIFARASELDADDGERDEASGRAMVAAPGASHGFTLPELQAIGAEAGISAAAIARAAHELSLGAPAPGVVQRWAGLPVAVGQELRLDTPVSDAEWTRIVVRLRDTFDARGTLRDQGAFREWSNGNLQATLEPTDTGHMLRLRTRKSSVRDVLGIAGGVGGFAGMLAVLSSVADKPNALPIAAMLGVVAIGMAGWQWVAIPRWAALRAEQMQAVLQSVLDERAQRLAALPGARTDEP